MTAKHFLEVKVIEQHPLQAVLLEKLHLMEFSQNIVVSLFNFTNLN